MHPHQLSCYAHLAALNVAHVDHSQSGLRAVELTHHRGCSANGVEWFVQSIAGKRLNMMDDLDPKDKSTQAYMLVGKFLSCFAILESTINNCVGKVLRLDGLQTYIVTRNAQFRDKIHILKAAAAMALPSTDALVQLLGEVDSINGDRNIVAHNVFGVSEDETGVEFLAVKARGKLTFPKVVWTPKDFEEKYARIGRVAEGIRHETDSGLKVMALAEALQKRPANALFGLAPNDFLSGPTPIGAPDAGTPGMRVPGSPPNDGQ
jgi:hypothetical protein